MSFSKQNKLLAQEQPVTGHDTTTKLYDMESRHYEQLHLLRECWLDKYEIEECFSEDDLLDLSDLYEMDSEFEAFCDADEVLEEAIGWMIWATMPKKRMRDYFYKFRDFCSGKGKLHDSPIRILLFYQKEDPSFRERCDADPVVQEVIERWFRKDDPDPVVRSLLEQWLSKNTLPDKASTQERSV